MAAPLMAQQAQLASSAQPSMSGLRELTNLNDITRVLHEMLARERGVNAELEGLITKRGTLEAGLVTLRSSTAEVRSLRAGTSEHLDGGIRQYHWSAKHAICFGTYTDAGGRACGCGVAGRGRGVHVAAVGAREQHSARARLRAVARS
jgi:hypothetical protein